MLQVFNNSVNKIHRKFRCFLQEDVIIRIDFRFILPLKLGLHFVKIFSNFFSKILIIEKKKMIYLEQMYIKRSYLIENN